MYIEQAYRGLADIWRYVVGLVAVFIFWQLGSIPLIMAVVLKSGSMGSIGGGDISVFANILGSNTFFFICYSLLQLA